MDTTETHYIQYDADALWNAITAAYAQEGGDLLYPGDEKEMLLRAVQSCVVQAFAGVDTALKMQTLRYAQGEYLDLIGETRRCERIEASAASATVTVVTLATGISGTLPAGSPMTSDGELFWLLDEDITLTGAAQTISAGVTAERTGTVGNGLTSGTTLTLQIPNPGISSITAATNASGGNDEEDDETYRERIRTYGMAMVGTGPAKQYEATAKAVSSNIVDTKAVNGGGGVVNVYLILSTQTGAAGVIADVTAALSADTVRPLTDTVAVAQATNVPYTLEVKYSLDTSSGATVSALSQAILDYQAWQDNVIGQTFNPDRLMAALYNAGASRILWGTGSNFNGGAVEYTPILSSQRCLGTITLTEITP